MNQLTFYLLIYVVGILWCKPVLRKVTADWFKDEHEIYIERMLNIGSWIPVLNLITAALATYILIQEWRISKLRKRNDKLEKKTKDIFVKNNIDL